ncbi:rod-binding protein [Phaeovibrio sulfidiphilus]|uniref:Rod-binding protein n=2 Tax=Phaeovibrio sulfidiphilus TaxID=1220600 RepID=A0A8J6YMQ8_9PROT|nr:rod-binding protein [Phaeovibrio sulfidiphilus]
MAGRAARGASGGAVLSGSRGPGASASAPFAVSGAPDASGVADSARTPSFARVLADGRGPAVQSRPGRSLPQVAAQDPARDPAHARYTPEQIEEARRTAQEFEAFFISQMLQPMFQELNSEPPFGGGNAERIWRSMMVDEYGSMIARNGGVGIADAVMREMLKSQEV